IPFAGRTALRHGFLFDRPHGFAVGPVEDKEEGGLVYLRKCLDLLAVHRDVEEHGRGRDVVVPKLVMNQLVIPDALAGLYVDTNDAVGEEIRAGALAAISIAAGRFDGDVNVAEFFIAGQRTPGAGIAGELPRFDSGLRIFSPRLGFLLACLRNGVEGPEELAGSHVVPANVAWCIQLGGQRDANFKRRADNRDVANDDRRRSGADGSVQNDSAVETFPEIHMRVDTEVRNGLAVFRVQSHQLVARRDEENAIVT